MATSLVCALALALLPSALAFRNTSPFFLFSTDDLNINTNEAGLAQASHISELALQVAKGCPSRTTFVVRQEAVSSTDFLDGLSTPRLSKHLGGQDQDVKNTIVVPEVVGAVDYQAIVSRLEEECGPRSVLASPDEMPALTTDEDSGGLVMQLTFPPASVADRDAKLAEYDAFLEKLIVDIAGGSDYTVFYTTTAQTEEQAQATLQNEHTYEMEDPFGDAVQMELKRDTMSHRRQANGTRQGGLFEKYQYFTPGIFMGFVAILPLFLILFVGMSALSSLQVSYFAFSKEMGPSGQKKQ